MTAATISASLRTLADEVDALPTGGSNPTPPPAVESVVEVAPGDGTPFGNITGNGGLSRIFSGAKTGTTDTATSASYRSGNSGFAGLSFSSPKRVDRVVVYGCSDVGLWYSSTSPTTVAIYGKNGAAPANDTDGTLLGTLTATDTNGIAINVPSTDRASSWSHVWARISQSNISNLWVGGIVISEIVLGAAPAQTVAIVSPVPNRVFQQTAGVASFGTDWRGSADTVRLNRVSDGALIAENATGDFSNIPAGWYSLSLIRSGAVVDTIKVGVGDVYVVAGQSNGVSQVQPANFVPIVPPAGRVIVSDYYGQGMHAFRDVNERPLLSSNPGMDAGVAWLYAGLALNRSYPVMFVSIAQGNTSTAVWASSPYLDRAVTAAVLFKPKAVLWLQGESDAGLGFSQAQSYANMHALISAVNGAAPNLPWVVALNSSAPAYGPIRAAQQQIDAAFANVHIGPDTDQYRAGQVEFLGDNLRLVGEAFASRLTALSL